MKKSIIAALILFYLSGLPFPSSTIAQNDFLSVNLNHPIPVGGEFYSDFYGIAGIDVNYGQPLNDYLFLSGNLGYSRSRSTKSDEINLDLFQAKLGLSAPVKFSPHFKFQPQFDFGYTLMKFFNKTIEQENKTSSIHRPESKDLNGWQTTVSLSWYYLLTDKFSIGLSTGYEFTYIDRKSVFGNYHQEMHAINLGIKTMIKL